MSHIHRLRSTDRVFYVTVNLCRSLETFDTLEYRMMIEVLESSRGRLGFLLCGYVLMPDHWHALISAGSPLTISQVVQNIKWISARSLNASRHASGPVWQHQFWDRFVRHEEEYAARFDYMHQNPVRKGLVSRPGEWRWSSYNNFALDKKEVRLCPIQVDYVGLPVGYRG